MDLLLNKDEKLILDEIIVFLKTLSVQEQYELNCFLKGINFAKSIKVNDGAYFIKEDK